MSGTGARSFSLEICGSSFSLSIPLASLSSLTLTNSDLPAFALQGTWAGGEQSSVLGLGIFSLLSLGARVAGDGGGRDRETSEIGKGKNRGREIEFPQGILSPKCNLEELQKSLFLFLFFSPREVELGFEIVGERSPPPLQKEGSIAGSRV